MKILEMRNTATNKERVDAVNRTEWSEVRTSELEDRKIDITQSELQRFKGKQKQKRTESVRDQWGNEIRAALYAPGNTMVLCVPTEGN